MVLANSQSVGLALKQKGRESEVRLRRRRSCFRRSRQGYRMPGSLNEVCYCSMIETVEIENRCVLFQLPYPHRSLEVPV